MKLGKKLAAAGLAAVTAVSVLTFTACDGAGYGDAKSAQEATNVIEKLDKVETNGISLNGNLKMNGIDVLLTGKANPTLGAFDVSMNAKQNDASMYMYYFMRDWKIYGAESEKEVSEFSSENLNPVVDLGALVSESLGTQSSLVTAFVPTAVKYLIAAENYTLLSLGKVTESVAYSGNTLTLDYNLAAYKMITDAKSVIDGLTATTTVGDILGNENVKKYAEIFTELVTYEQLTSVVTMIKTALNGQFTPQLPMAMADEDLGEGGNDNPDTPENPDVPEYPEYPEETITVEEIKAIVDQVDRLLKMVKPAEGSTTYDYILRLLSSNALRNTINTIVGEEVLAKEISKYTLQDIISLATDLELTEAEVNQGLAEFKAQVAKYTQGITKESATITIGTTTVVESGMLYTFTYDNDHILISQGMSANIAYTDSAYSSNNQTISISLTVNYGKDALTLSKLPALLPEFPNYGGDSEEGNVIE